ncbi:hypothetical protein LCGC14_1181030 [marine sediment metagenome]|uniref:Phage tail tape measure protein domain-containing protein n=1 Tax=marine sediment metagenome TaxID=412755 RepID=A0A0F9LRX6_9ZZZZ
MDSRQRHIIQTIYDKTGLVKYQKDMEKTQAIARRFGNEVSASAKFMGTSVKKSFNKSGEVITRTTGHIEQNGKRMNVVWSNTKKGANGLRLSISKVGAQMNNFNAIIGKVVQRALLVAPAWMLIRSAMILVIRTVKDMITAFIDLDEGLARIRTVMHGNAEDINAEMAGIRRQILDTAVDSKISIKELAEAMYFLKTASLDVGQAISAFTPTVNAMIGTGVGAREMARSVAGVFNTMGKFITGTANDAEKFQKIADVLTFTFATQDVEMKELIAGYTKLAPFLSGLDDSFTDIVTTLGVLNTRMLRSGRTGRLTGRAILQLTKNSSKLASIFGITFDANKPINFLKTIEAISKAMKDTEKVTFAQSEAIRQIFATRGGVGVKLLLADFEGLKKAIDEAGIGAGGFAEKIAKIKMRTISAQTQRTKIFLLFYLMNLYLEHLELES